MWCFRLAAKVEAEIPESEAKNRHLQAWKGMSYDRTVCLCASVCIHVCVCACVCASMHACVHIHMNIQDIIWQLKKQEGRKKQRW